MPRQLLAQFGGYGFNPGQAIFMPMPGFNAEAHYDTSQVPVGWHGIKPVCYESDGTPVYAQMPVYDEVEEEFVVQIYFPISDRFSLPRKVKVPAAGRKRKKFRKRLEAELKKAQEQSQINTAMEYCSGERMAELTESEMREERYRERQQYLRDKEHQRQLDLKDQLFYHMNDNQLQHFRDGWQPIVQPVGGLQYGTPDLMVAPDGNTYWVP